MNTPVLPPFINPENIYTVDELNNSINEELQQSFGTVYVEGEISNLTKPASGHYYFTLKDSKAQVRCALFKGYKQFIQTKIDNGQKILVKAKISIYTPRGDYQLIIEHVYPTGLGALQQAFEALKKKLQAEGLFDIKYKKPIPTLPTQIYVITSPSGAAIRDILITLKRRFASIPVKIIPTLVQGETAATQITKAILFADAIATPNDIIILARGGGSLEDLWAFNDETLARTIFNIKTPIISGIGHEIDFTIADFVADLRAATPTAAAEAATPNIFDYTYKINNLEQLLIKSFKFTLYDLFNELKHIQNRLLKQHPEYKLHTQTQYLDELSLKLSHLSDKFFNHKYHQVKLLLHQLEQNNPINEIKLKLNNINHYQKILNNSISTLLNTNKNNLQNNIQRLNSVNPLEVLARGYSVLKTESEQVITSSTQVKPGDRIVATLSRGQINCEVIK
jgi:exodeoxyribonuclease VII large subunit